MAKFPDVGTLLNTSTSSDGSLVFFKLKTQKKAAGWTVVSSSDGTTYNASSDIITTNLTGAGGLHNASAWFVIREPGGRREWCYQHISTAMLYRVKYSPFARFIGGSPSATRVPSATDEQVLAGGGTDASPTGGSFFNAVVQRCHVMCNSTPIGGVYPFYFFMTASPGTTEQAGAIWCEPMAPGSYDAGDLDPCIVGAATSGGGIASMVSSGSKAYFAYGTGSQAFATMTSGVNATFNGTLPANIVNGKFMCGRPLYTATVAATTQPKGYGGTIALKGSPHNYPTTYNRATDAYVVLGNLVLPYADNTEPGV